MPDESTDREMDEMIRRSMQTEVPPAVEERLRDRLTEFRVKLAEPPTPRFQWPRLVAVVAAAALLVGIGLIWLPGGSFHRARVYAAAAGQLKAAQSLAYSIVLNDAPYVGVDFTFAAPAFRRVLCSWGIEIRTDGASRKQIVLMHLTHTYMAGPLNAGETVEPSSDVVAQLKSLPATADQFLGEKTTDGRRLLGYRVRKEPVASAIANLQTFDLWVDASTQLPDHADIATTENGKPHVMHITGIRVDGAVDRSLFDLTPPAGYTPIALVKSQPRTEITVPAMEVEIRQSSPITAVVIPMAGPYSQTRAALEAVAAYLAKRGITPAGAPLGRFESESHWLAGYPVTPGATVEAPYELLSLPSSTVASWTAAGPWGQATDQRWSAFIQSVVEQGFEPAGPAMEIWHGDDVNPAAQATEMRMEVKKAAH
jgi:DNA gyrase inhibitor GyrI